MGPMIAAIQFEEDRQRHEVSVQEAISKQRQEAERKLAAVQLQAEPERQRRQAPELDATLKQQPEEERRHAEALQWAERYRQRRDAAEQEAVFKQRPEEMRKLAQVQIGEQGPWQKAEERKLADAGSAPAKGLLAEKRADQGRGLAKSRVAQCTKSCRTKAGRTKGGRRVAYQPRGRVSRTRNAICPLRWLQAVLMDSLAPVVEQRGSRRHYRHVAAG